MPITNILDLVQNQPYVLVDRQGKVFDVFFSGFVVEGVAQFCTTSGEVLSISYPVEDVSWAYPDHYTCYQENEIDQPLVFKSDFILGLGHTFDWLEGKVFSKVIRKDDSVVFLQKQTPFKIVLKHEQECCEQVYLGDVIGDLKDLENTPLLEVKETKSSVPEAGPAYFYDFRTIKGSVTLRFIHENNSNWAYSAKATFSVSSS